MKKKSYSDIDEYISDFPDKVASRLQRIREIGHEVAPDATEGISYNMPVFKLGKVLFYFAAYEKHIGLYALPSGNIAFRKELARYKTGKGSIQLPLKEELPVDLIRSIILFRLGELTKKG